MTDELLDEAECAWDLGHGLCACAAEDPAECLALRAGGEPDAFAGEECECCCHEGHRDWLDELLAPLPPVLLAGPPAPGGE